MSVTVSATKTVSSKLPYTGKTFQRFASVLVGRDGYISGGAATDDGVHIALDEVTFIQRGIVAQAVAIAGVVVPTAPAPWFVLAAIPDDNPDSGVVISATADPGIAAAGLVIAYKTDGRWKNPIGVDGAGGARRSAETGTEAGIGVLDNVDVATNELDSLFVYKGTVVDALGERRNLLTETPATNAAIAKDVATLRAHATRYRSDHLVLRQPEGHSPEIVLAMGPTSAGGAAVAPATLATPAAPAKRAGYYAARGGTANDQWWAWGDAAALKLKVGGGAAATLLTGAGNIKDAWVVAPLPTEAARVIIVYVDGLLLRVVSTTLGGVLSEGPVTIANTGGQISRVRAVLDHGLVLHFTFENDEATQQIYYGTCSIDPASFGAVGISARIVTGAATATNDTWPSIGIDRKGMVTVAYIQGAGVAEFGDMVIATLDATGELVSQVEVEAATDVAIDSRDITSPLPSGFGFEPTPFLNFRRTAVVVSPYDEVYVLTIGLDAGPDPHDILIYNEEFATKHGAAVVNAMPRITALANGPHTALAAACGDQGEIVIGIKTVVPANSTRLHLATLNPRPFEGGREDAIVYLGYNLLTAVEASGFNDLLLVRNPGGGYQINYVNGLNVDTIDLASTSTNKISPHPRDVQLGGIVVPPGAVVPEVDQPGFEVFNARPKKMNFPFLVGNRGDYQGHNSLYQAVVEAARVNGEVVVRSGHHVLKDGPLRFKGRIRGEGRSVILLDGDDQVIYGGDQALAVGFTHLGNNVLASVASYFADLYAGCVLEIAAGAGPVGRHHVLRNMGYDSVNARFRSLVGSAVNVIAGGAGNANVFWGGLSLEDLTIGSINGNPMVKIENGYKPLIRNVSLMGGIGMHIELVKCIQPLVDNVDLTDCDNGTDPILVLDGNEFAVCRDVRLTGGQGVIHVLNNNTKPTFIHCGSEEANPATDIVFDIDGQAQLLSCAGLVDGDAVTLINPKMIVDNTNGNATVELAEFQGKETQEAALIGFLGRWRAGLGIQTMMDPVGELVHKGDYFCDDFHELNGELWDITLVEHGRCKTPGDGEGEHGLSAADFYPTQDVSRAVRDNGGLGEGAWSYTLDQVEVVASLKHLKPGDTLTTVLWSFSGPSVGAATFTISLYRRDLSTGAAAAVVQQTNVPWNTAGAHQSTQTYNHTIEAGYAYWLGAYVVAASSLVNLQFLGATAKHTNRSEIGTQHGKHAVELSLSAVDATDSTAPLRSRFKVGAWGEKPLTRIRLKIGDLTDAALFHLFGFFTDVGLGCAYFIHDPGNAAGHGASNEIRFVVRNDASVPATVLTGITPNPNQYYWFWIGYKSATEAYWGISNERDGAFLASGALSVGASVIRPDDFDIAMWVGNVNASGGAPDTTLTIDTVEYRSSTRHPS
jgi:hypothetical protein